MDQAFFLRAKRLLEQRQTVELEHGMLLDALKAQRTGSPTAAAASHCPAAAPPPGAGHKAIASLVLGEENWREAAEMQAGCFNRAEAARPVNTASTQFTGIFT